MFEEMVKAYEKCKKVVEKEGHFKQYIRAIAELETFINELWTDTEWRKSASKNNSGALSKLRQRIRKYNKDFEKEIADFRENPDQFPEEEKIETGRGRGEDAESDEDEDESDEDESESDEDESDEDEKPSKSSKSKRVYLTLIAFNLFKESDEILIQLLLILSYFIRYFKTDLKLSILEG